MKRFIVLMLAFVIVTLSASAGLAVVAINETNFPDSTLRGYMNNFDTNGDKILSNNEIINATSVSISDSSLRSLEGIKHLTALQDLYCSYSSIKELDLSNMTSLREVDCYGANNKKLASVNLSGCTSLTHLNCNSSGVTSLNLTGCVSLQDLHCEGNALTAIDISACTDLRWFYCNNNKLSSLNVKNCTQLRYLYVNDNLLTALDVSGNPELDYLECRNNRIAALDLSNNTNLNHLYCNNNRLSMLDVEDNTNIYGYNCSPQNIDGLVVTPQSNGTYTVSLRDYLSTSIKNVTASSIYGSDSEKNLIEGSYNSETGIITFNVSPATIYYEYDTKYSKDDLKRYMGVTMATSGSPVITTSSMPAGAVNTPYEFQFEAKGEGTTKWTVEGTLPEGLTFTEEGKISGTPTQAGTYKLTVTAENDFGSQAKDFAFSVAGEASVTPPSITTGENLGAFNIGDNISLQLAATGDTPITWTADNVPSGLMLDTSGLLSGAFTAAGTYTFTVTATNTGGNDSRTFTITVNAVPIPVTAPTITTDENLGTFKTGAEISIQLSATGDNPITWTASELPEGLAVDSEGKISGTITVAGDYSFTVTASNAGGNDSRTFTLKVEAHAAAPSITTTSINGGKTGTSYTATFTATGSDPITWTAGGLPEGFSMSESGTLSGTTETAGTYTITVTATNSAGSDTKEYTLTIEETVKITPPKITTESLPSATEGQSYSEQITADGIGITWSNSGGLPAGLSFSKDGILSGTPEKSGTFRVTLVAKNSAGVDSKIFTLTIESGTISAQAPVIKTSKLPDGFIDWDYNYQIEAEGTVTSWEISDPQNFPAGLELNETTGEITGNIRTSKAKTFKFKVIAYNGSTGSKAKTLSLKVISKKPDFKTEDIKAAKWGSKYSFTMKLSNFKATAWSIVGDIPEGLTFDKGKFTGKPLEVGEFEVSITASNGAVDIEDDFILKVNGIAPKLKGSLKSGKENTYYECILKATGTTPIEWEFGNENGEGTLPEGLSWIQSETGDSCKIYGTPEQAFSQRVIITLTNGDNEADSITKSLKMTIKAVKPKFKTKAKDVPAGKTGEDYECQIELDTKATPFAVEWEYSGEMPEGLYFDEGLIYGVPSETGNFPITITVRNANNTTYKAILRITLRITENKTALPSEETTASEDSRPEFVNGIAYYERGEIRAEILARAVNAGEIIAAVLPAVEVEECGMYEFAVSIDKVAPEGSVMVWHSYPNGEDNPDDKDNAVFLDAEGETIEKVPADYTVTVGAWLEPGVIYEPVITVKR